MPYLSAHIDSKAVTRSICQYCLKSLIFWVSKLLTIYQIRKNLWFL